MSSERAVTSDAKSLWCSRAVSVNTSVNCLLCGLSLWCWGLTKSVKHWLPLQLMYTVSCWTRAAIPCTLESNYSLQHTLLPSVLRSSDSDVTENFENMRWWSFKLCKVLVLAHTYRPIEDLIVLLPFSCLWVEVRFLDEHTLLDSILILVILINLSTDNTSIVLILFFQVVHCLPKSGVSPPPSSKKNFCFP